LAGQDGMIIVVATCVAVSWFLGLKLYAMVLQRNGVHWTHIPDSGMHKWTFAG
jgi:hypothetical protein